MNYHKLMGDFSRLAGLDDVEFEDAGGYFEIGGQPLFLAHEAAFGRITLSAPVATLKASESDLAGRLLELNLMLMRSGGYAFGYDPETATCLLVASHPIAALDAAGLDAAISAIVAKTEAARGLVLLGLELDDVADAKALNDLMSRQETTLIRA
ncbi:type III secretion system chaperone [Prosthecodimorpha staleyi]|uniref:Type III secretion system chaperone n=1 Tax=Prosthecodimorpha staleyi TaxID=2840188 RepID=A0A947D659_9HYPH|nr:type III secretion system chaperone [Prosthecodimorpha staleyi]MBT9291780.1 type III secretion system chaperone [Prosthecodimorpha staleyi]